MCLCYTAIDIKRWKRSQEHALSTGNRHGRGGCIHIGIWEGVFEVISFVEHSVSTRYTIA
jgi:hypothetical protein